MFTTGGLLWHTHGMSTPVFRFDDVTLDPIRVDGALAARAQRARAELFRLDGTTPVLMVPSAKTDASRLVRMLGALDAKIAGQLYAGLSLMASGHGGTVHLDALDASDVNAALVCWSRL